jgi:hypothetical protein
MYSSTEFFKDFFRTTQEPGICRKSRTFMFRSTDDLLLTVEAKISISRTIYLKFKYNV